MPSYCMLKSLEIAPTAMPWAIAYTGARNLAHIGRNTTAKAVIKPTMNPPIAMPGNDSGWPTSASATCDQPNVAAATSSTASINVALIAPLAVIFCADCHGLTGPSLIGAANSRGAVVGAAHPA